MAEAQGPIRATVRASSEATTLELSAAVALKSGATFGVVSHAPEALLLFRDGAAPAGYFAGSLSSLSLAEVVGHVISGIRTGKLWVSAGAARRSVSFRDGQIVFATSSEPHERFGRTLVRLGLLSADKLQAALAEVKPGAKLGQVLKKRGWVSAASLYSAMTELVRDIVLNLFELTEGSFIFLEGAPMGEDAVKLPGKVRDLVLEGVRRGEQVQLLRSRFPPHMRLMLGLEEGAPSPLLARVGQGASVAELWEAHEGSEHAFLCWLHDELHAGVLAVQPFGKEPKETPAPAPVPEPTGALERYAGLVSAISRALLDAGQSLADLRSFLEDPLPGMEASLQGVTLSDAGVLDIDRLMENATGADVRLGRVKAYEALDAFVSYGLFSAKNVLPPERAEALARDFRKLQLGGGE